MIKRILILFAVCLFFSCKKEKKKYDNSTIEYDKSIEDFFINDLSEKIYELGTTFKYSFKSLLSFLLGFPSNLKFLFCVFMISLFSSSDFGVIF